MNYKEFAKKEPRLAPGHGLCGGCAAPTIVKTILGATDKPVVVANATGCLEVSTTIYPSSAWKVPWIHSAFENVSATIAGCETAYKSLKKQGKVKDDITFVAFGGDGSSYDIGLQSLSGALERGHDFLYVCYDNEAYMNCLSLDSMILTQDGLRKITEIKEGDKLYSFDADTRDLVLRECAGVYDNGVKEVFEVRTLHHSLKATGNHPFLVIRHNGRGHERSFEWRTVEELKKGDKVVVLSKLNGGKSYRFPEIEKRTKEDYKVNVLNDISIPEESSPDLMKYLGIYVGDGWVRSGRGDVGFSLPEGTEEREELLRLHKKVFGSKYTESKDEVHINSVNLARFISSLGFGSGAKNKSVPDWVFTLPIGERDAFVEGLMLSDGYQVKGSKSMRYVSASFPLLTTVGLLLQTIGYRVGKMHVQTKKAGTQVVKRVLLKDSEYGYICFSKPAGWDVEKYPTQYRYVNPLVDNENFDAETVREIVSKGFEPTLDLQVRDSHNFIANGYVVHNTGNQRSGSTPFCASTTTEPAGKVSPGKSRPKKDLMKIAVAHDIPYAAQASIGNWLDLANKAEKALQIEGPKVMVVYSPCTTMWNVKSSTVVDIAKLLTDTCAWPLYEVIDGQYKLNYKPKEKKPVADYLKTQPRFRHMFAPGNEKLLAEAQERVDKNWANLLKLCGESP